MPRPHLWRAAAAAMKAAYVPLFFRPCFRWTLPADLGERRSVRTALKHHHGHTPHNGARLRHQEAQNKNREYGFQRSGEGSGEGG